MKRAVISILAFWIFIAPSVAAADRAKIRSINIGAQAIVTLVSGIVQGKVKRPADVAKCLVAGSVAGYGFYEAKISVANRHIQTGWLLSNLAASISENTAAGKAPWAQLGYSIGPFRFRVPLGTLDASADSYVYVDVSEYETLQLIYAYRENDQIRFRSGLVVFERNSLYPADDDGIVAIGRAYGIFPGISSEADEATWPHEVVHSIQALQADAAEPSLSFLTYKPADNDKKAKRFIRFEHLKLGLFNLANDGIVGRQRYHNRWLEIEAFRLTEDIAPPRF